MTHDTPRPEAFVDLGVLIEYLTHATTAPSALRLLARQVRCFTSVLEAAELLAAADSPAARAHAESVLWGVHVLGMHQRYALSIADVHRAGGGTDLRDSITAGICIANRLPVATFEPERYAGYRGLMILDARVIAAGAAWTEAITTTSG